MLVVGDSSVLIKFAVVERFECLKTFSPIYVPEEVYNEVYYKGRYKPGSQEIHDAVKEGWIIVRRYTDKSFYEKFPYLHEGERQALTLAFELKANIVLLDDADAVAVYKTYLRPLGVKRLSTGGACDLLFKIGKIDISPDIMKLKLLENAMKINQIK